MRKGTHTRTHTHEKIGKGKSTEVSRTNLNHDHWPNGTQWSAVTNFLIPSIASNQLILSIFVSLFSKNYIILLHTLASLKIFSFSYCLSSSILAAEKTEC